MTSPTTRLITSSFWPLAIAASALSAPPLQPAPTPYTRVSRDTGRTTFLSARPGRTLEVTPADDAGPPTDADFLRQYGPAFGVRDPDNELIRADRTIDRLGHTHTTYRQMHRGVPVFSGTLKLHQDPQGRFIAANGDVRPIKPTLNVQPTLAPAEAERIATAALPDADPDTLRTERNDLTIIDPGWYGQPPTGPHLAYHLVLADPQGMIRQAFFIEAHTGAILDQWSMVCNARVRSVHDGFGGSDCCFEHSGPGCDDATCAAAVCEGRPECCADTWQFTCAADALGECESLCIPGALARAEGEPPTGIDDIDAVYDYLGDTYDFFQLAYGRDSYDAAGATMVASARWPFLCPNAFWDGQRMAFCIGTAGDDVVAHELMHALTEHTAGLIYRNQSGQLNESFSDVFGELVDLFNGGAAFAEETGPTPWNPHQTGPGTDAPNFARTMCSDIDTGYADGVRWLVSEDATAFGGPIRDMWDPTCMGDPDRANSPLQTCDRIDAGGVHSGSGIPNHAFALATDGGTFNGFTIRGIGPLNTGAVWYRALTVYLHVASDFQDTYDALTRAAIDLIGTSPLDPRTGFASSEPFTADDAEQIDRALRAVEMDTPGRCGRTVPVLSSDPPPICENATLILADNFETGPGAWQVSNSAPPTPYDWQRVDALPYERPGTAWFIENRDIGDCNDRDETGLHSLISPSIPLPDDVRFPVLTFTHLMISEPGFDGGRVAIRVNDGDWQPLPMTAFEFNPYNTVIRHAGTSGNTSPLAGEEGFTGAGGRWGTSVIDLQSFASGGDTVAVRFDFGKDGCNGVDGWYVDDIQVLACPDCNRNDVRDIDELLVTAASGPLSPFGAGSWQAFTPGSLPPATGDVTLSVSARAALSGHTAYIRMLLNFEEVGQLFVTDGNYCPLTRDERTITIPADLFNRQRLGGVSIRLLPSPAVYAPACNGHSFVTVFLSYPSAATDADDNGVPDACEDCHRADPARAPQPPVAKNRYLSLHPANAGRLTAMKLTAVHLPDRFLTIEGRSWWVGPPHKLSEIAGKNNASAPTVSVAPLQCEPHYHDFGAIDELHVYGAPIVPDGRYNIHTVDVACGGADAESRWFSEQLTIPTGLFADVTGPCDAADCALPDGRVDITDLVAALDKFDNRPGAITKVRVDLAPAIPDGIVDIADVVLVLDAFRGASFSFTPPTPCG